MRGIWIFVTIFVFLPNILNGQSNEEEYQDQDDDNKRFQSEAEMGDLADLMGTNPHYAQPNNYNDLGRRFVPQYPYVEVPDAKLVETEEGDIIPQRAPPELVLNIARQSALLARSEPENTDDENMRKQILRSGDYWNGVWTERVDQKQILRSPNVGQSLSTIKIKIMPDSKYYDLISQLQKVSPRLLYIVNKKNND